MQKIVRKAEWAAKLYDLAIPIPQQVSQTIFYEFDADDWLEERAAPGWLNTRVLQILGSPKSALQGINDTAQREMLDACINFNVCRVNAALYLACMQFDAELQAKTSGKLTAEKLGMRTNGLFEHIKRTYMTFAKTVAERSTSARVLHAVAERDASPIRQ